MMIGKGKLNYSIKWGSSYSNSCDYKRRRRKAPLRIALRLSRISALPKMIPIEHGVGLIAWPCVMCRMETNTKENSVAARTTCKHRNICCRIRNSFKHTQLQSKTDGSLVIKQEFKKFTKPLKRSTNIDQIWHWGVDTESCGATFILVRISPL